ncbi:MAG: hypothetical protein ACI8S6_004085 [Myxococcota bacterium]|jgi:hypothetical protein
MDPAQDLLRSPLLKTMHGSLRRSSAAFTPGSGRMLRYS